MRNSTITDETEREPFERPFSITVILHERASPIAPFLHALSLASVCKGDLEIVDLRHSRAHSPAPGVRRTFEQWRKLPAGSSREDVGRLGLHVKKIRKRGSSRKEIVRRLDSTAPDLLVIGTRQRRGFGHLFGQDLAEYLAHSRRQTTLYIPGDATPFVAAETGHLSLERIVVPVAESPPSEPALLFLRRLLSFVPDPAPGVIGLHIGEQFPYLAASSLEGISWEEIREPIPDESVAAVITRTATRRQTDLIVMATNGRDT
jgi:nucleotide-binding universal stress UspA family protein